MLPVSITRRERDVMSCLADGLDDGGKRASLVHKPAHGQSAYS